MSQTPDSTACDGSVRTTSHGRMHYREQGRGDPLILIHTNGGSAWQYAACSPLLARRFRVIAWDMPGQGDSDPLARHYGIEDYCDALAAFMDALAIDRAHVSGCSCGGTITGAFGVRHAARTRSAVVVETPFRTAAEWAARWDHTEGNFGIPTQSIDDVKSRVARVDEHVLERWNVDRNKAGAKTMVSVMWAMRDFDIAAAVAAATRPTMVLYGARGPTVALRDRVKAANAAVPVETLAGSGHFPMLDEPEAFAEVHTRFCTAA
jgi:pimeloyl-ACP methyl ester carboxylesterase